MDYLAEEWLAVLNGSYTKYDYNATLDTLPIKVMQPFSQQIVAVLAGFKVNRKKLLALNLMFGKYEDRQVRYIQGISYADMMALLTFFYDSEMKIRRDRVDWLETWITKKLQNAD